MLSKIIFKVFYIVNEEENVIDGECIHRIEDDDGNFNEI